MKHSFTREEVDKIEDDAYLVGVLSGEARERARIVELLKADFNDEHGYVVDRIELLRNLIALIKGENE